MFDRMVQAVQAEGVDKRLDDILRSGQGGSPRDTRMDVYVAGIIATACSGRRLTIMNVWRLLTQGLPHSAQVAYGIRRSVDGVSHAYTYRQMTYPLQALKDKLGIDTDEEMLQELMDAIVATSLPDHLPPLRSLALDATGIQSWAKGKSSRRRAGAGRGRLALAASKDEVDVPRSLPAANDSLCSFDPDARWGYRTKTYSNATSAVFGYNVISVVGVPAVGAAKDGAPVLTQGIRLRPANADVVGPGLELVDDYRGRCGGVDEVLNDRAWSYSVEGTWMDPLRSRGVEQILDLHPNDHGVRDFEGLRMVDGTPHCPAMPDHLVRIDRPPRFHSGPPPSNASREKRAQYELDKRRLEQFNELIAQRQTWAFRRVAGPDRTGKERWECPAQAGRRVCANCPLSQMYDESTPRVQDPPTGPGIPKCCTQRTVTIPGDVTPKIRQRLYWGSVEWIKSYNRRTYVEGSYGNLKNPDTENITRGWCRVVGLVKTGILLAAAVAASNIRLLRLWAKRTGDFTAPISAPDPDYQPWEEVDADGVIITHAPPMPAGP